MQYILHVAASDEADITDNLVVYTIKREDSTVKLKSYIKQIKGTYPKTLLLPISFNIMHP